MVTYTNLQFECKTEIESMPSELLAVGMSTLLMSIQCALVTDEALQHKHVSLIPTQTLTLVSQAKDITLSPDGKNLSVWDDEDVVSLRDARTGKIKFTLDIISDYSKSFVFSPDGQRFAAVDASGSIRLWDVDSGIEQRVSKTNYAMVPALAFSPDGKTLASSSGRNQDVILWDIESGRKLQGLPVELVFSLAFSPDGKLLATGNTGGEIVIWDWMEGQRIQTLFDSNCRTLQIVHSLQFLKDGESMIAAYGPLHPYRQRSGIRIWNLNTGEQLVELLTPRPASRIAVSPDEQNVAVAMNAAHKARSADIAIFNLAEKRHIASFAAHENVVDKSQTEITALQFSSSGQQITSGGRDGVVKHWELSELTGRRVSGEHK
jgi:WD40 repeat protein